MLNKRTFSDRQRAIKRRSVHYRAVITVSNTDKRLMDALSVQTGVVRVYGHARGQHPEGLRKRLAYTWRLANDDIRKWLPKIRPYLVLKGEQADLLLEALDIKVLLTPVKGELTHMSVDHRQRLDDIYAMIRALNTKGRTTCSADS